MDGGLRTVRVWLRWLFTLSGGGCVGGWVGLPLQGTQAKQDSERARESRQARKKGQRGGNQGAHYVTVGAALHDKCGSYYCTGWEVEVGVGTVCVRDPELTDLTFSEGEGERRVLYCPPSPRESMEIMMRSCRREKPKISTSRHGINL